MRQPKAGSTGRPPRESGVAAPFLKPRGGAGLRRTHPCLAPPPRPSNSGMPAEISWRRSPAGVGRGRQVERTPPKRVGPPPKGRVVQLEFDVRLPLGSGHRRSGKSEWCVGRLGVGPEDGCLCTCARGAAECACGPYAAVAREQAHACKLACITRASCANAQNARCAQLRRAPACRGVCRPPAAHSTRNSELHLMMPIVLHNPAKPDCSVQLKQSSLSSMCRSNCRCRLSAIP